MYMSGSTRSFGSRLRHKKIISARIFSEKRAGLSQRNDKFLKKELLEEIKSSLEKKHSKNNHILTGNYWLAYVVENFLIIQCFATMCSIRKKNFKLTTHYSSENMYSRAIRKLWFTHVDGYNTVILQWFDHLRDSIKRTTRYNSYAVLRIFSRGTCVWHLSAMFNQQLMLIEKIITWFYKSFARSKKVYFRLISAPRRFYDGYKSYRETSCADKKTSIWPKPLREIINWESETSAWTIGTNNICVIKCCLLLSF